LTTQQSCDFSRKRPSLALTARQQPRNDNNDNNNDNHDSNDSKHTTSTPPVMTKCMRRQEASDPNLSGDSRAVTPHLEQASQTPRQQRKQRRRSAPGDVLSVTAALALLRGTLDVVAEVDPVEWVVRALEPDVDAEGAAWLARCVRCVEAPVLARSRCGWTVGNTKGEKKEGSSGGGAVAAGV